MSLFTTALASFTLVTAAAAPAVAAPLDAAPSVEVRHGDLDLTRTHDVARLNRRIAFAAKAVCGSYDPRKFAETARATACINETIAAASVKAELAVARANEGAKLASALPADAVAVH